MIRCEQGTSCSDGRGPLPARYVVHTAEGRLHVCPRCFWEIWRPQQDARGNWISAEVCERAHARRIPPRDYARGVRRVPA